MLIKKIILLFALLLFCFTAFSQSDKPAYQMFDAKGKKTKYQKLLKAIGESDVIFFGELHFDPIAHWLQFELIKDTYDNKFPVQIGAEMLENHQQWALDLYQSGKINAKSFEDTVKMWSNYPTDYAPIVDYAMERHIPVFATNIPRIYARAVARNGQSALDTVPAERKKWIVPLPFEVNFDLPTYKTLLEGGISHGKDAPTVQAKNFVSAQAIKDATMAYRIFTNYKEGSKFFHLNGSYHSDFKEGIIWYLKKHNPKLKILNISTVYQNQIKLLNKDNLNKADFIFAIPENMTQTQRLRF